MRQAKPQPVKGVLAMRRVPNTVIAELTGLHVVHVGRLLNGRHVPSSKFRQQLSTLLDLPEADLFREEPS